jgi:hypothetical protein
MLYLTEQFTYIVWVQMIKINILDGLAFSWSKKKQLVKPFLSNCFTHDLRINSVFTSKGLGRQAILIFWPA